MTPSQIAAGIAEMLGRDVATLSASETLTIYKSDGSSITVGRAAGMSDTFGSAASSFASGQVNSGYQLHIPVESFGILWVLNGRGEAQSSQCPPSLPERRFQLLACVASELCG